LIHGTSRLVDQSGRAHVGFDFFYASGYTRGLPAMIPIAMIYNNAEKIEGELRVLFAGADDDYTLAQQVRSADNRQN